MQPLEGSDLFYADAQAMNDGLVATLNEINVEVSPHTPLAPSRLNRTVARLTRTQ